MVEKITLRVGNDKLIGVLHKGVTDQNKVGDHFLNTAVISCHGLLASKDSVKYILLAEELSSRGISTFRFDFRGCGESDGRMEESHISSRVKDLQVVINYMSRDLGYSRLGLFGSSMGGFISFFQASIDPRIKVLVTLSSPISMAELFNAKDLVNDSYEIDGVVFQSTFLKDIQEHGTLTKEALEKINCPTYIFHGDFDSLVPIEHAHRLFENLNTEKKFKIILGGDHIFSTPSQLAEIIGTTIDWFQHYLPEDSKSD